MFILYVWVFSGALYVAPAPVTAEACVKAGETALVNEWVERAECVPVRSI